MSQIIPEGLPWKSITLPGGGVQPQTTRWWDCVPAWDVTALQREADGVVRHPGGNGTRFVFRDRHVDRRFHIEYPHATRETPHAVGRTIGDPGREWDILIEHRDRYLREAGLSLSSPPEAIARCFANTFATGASGHFDRKPMCTTFAESPRNLSHGIEGLLHKSFCVGCAKAFGLLADACGIPSRFIGCGAHYVAEVRIGNTWHMADSIGRHEKNAGYPMYFPATFMDLGLNPSGDFGMTIPDGLREGFFKRANGQFHFHGGHWDGPQTLRFAMSNAFALYPDAPHWGFKSDDGRRLPLVANRGGFYWPIVHDRDVPQLLEIRRAAFPDPLTEVLGRDYLCHPLKPGQRLRQSFWLGNLDGLESVEVAIPFAPSRQSDFTSRAGRQLMVRLGDWTRSLDALGAWPPAEGSPGTMPAAVIHLPPELLKAESVHWLELENAGRATYHMPCVPNVMEPYLAPLGDDSREYPDEP
jgi:hypothetical protein